MSEGSKTYLTLREMQLALDEMLQRFDAYCRDRGLAYSLSSGTLLGGVREHGFIAWDDDLDLSMARPAYEELVGRAGELERETGLILRGHMGIGLADAPFAKLCRADIALRPQNERDEGLLSIDVFPADGLPGEPGRLAAHYAQAAKLQRMLMFLGSTPQSGHSLGRRLLKYMVTPLASSKTLRAHYGRKLVELAKSVPYGSTPYCGHLTWGLAGTGERVHLEGYERRVELEFEGHPCMAMSCYDEYLNGVYGPTYMTPPPKGRRHSHHAKAWRIDGEAMR